MKKSGTELEEVKNSNNDLKQALAARIGELTKELQDQMAIKDAILKKVKEIDIRSTQLVGAISEMQKLQKTEKKEEKSEDIKQLA